MAPVRGWSRVVAADAATKPCERRPEALESRSRSGPAGTPSRPWRSGTEQLRHGAEPQSRPPPRQQRSRRVQRPRPAPEPAAAPPEARRAPPESDFRQTMRDTLHASTRRGCNFPRAAVRFPSERMDERSERRRLDAQADARPHRGVARPDRTIGWSRCINTGEPLSSPGRGPVQRPVRRRAIGRTAGEILKDMEATFNRLRRQLQRLTDAQLRADDRWAACSSAATPTATTRSTGGRLRARAPAKPGAAARAHRRWLSFRRDRRARSPDQGPYCKAGT